MKLTIDAKELNKALAGDVSRSSTNDIWSHALLSCENDVLTLSTRNHMMQYDVSVACHTEEPGRATAMPRELKNALAGIDGAINIEPANANAIQVSQKAGNRTRKLRVQTLDPGDWPAQPETDREALPISAGELLKGIKCVAYAAAKNDVRYYLTGVMVNGRTIAATDGHRLAAYPVKSDMDYEIIIPRDAIGKITALLEEDRAELMINALHTTLQVTTPDKRLSVQLIDGRYPDINRVIPSCDMSTIVINTDDARNIVARASAMELRKIEKALASKLAFKPVDSVLYIEGKAVDDFISCICEPNDITLCLDSRYLVDVLTAIDEEATEWHYSEARAAYRFNGIGNASVHVIMPMAV